MNVFHPTADDLLLLATAQRNNQKRLDDLQSFTPENAKEALLNCHVWLESEHDWAVSVADLARLAFDTRMPDGFARILQKMVNWAKTNNQHYIHPNAKPQWL